MLALFAYDFFIVGDYLLAPQYIVRAVVVRFAVMTPLVLLVAFAARRNRSHTVREAAAALMCFAVTVSILYLYHGVSSLASVEETTGLILVLLVSNCMLRVDLPLAVPLSCAIGVAQGFNLAYDRLLEPSQKLLSGGMLAWVIFLTLTANYTLTRERRFSWLLQLRARLQRGLLAEANAELMALSATDRLTGIPNRRAYDIRMAEMWRAATEAGQPLSAIMVDVDHFKKLNDSYGHPYGDRVLQRVASLLQQALRAEEDFVARIGGEEFVVLLPDTQHAIAMKVAERIRTLVQVAGSPALQRDTQTPQEVWATVSCGVATAWPGGEAQSAARLVAEADEAMYRAKREGRNRVCCPSSMAIEPAKVTMFPGASHRA
jgi:diguanylate cyclase (GGDEF)-like protein